MAGESVLGLVMTGAVPGGDVRHALGWDEGNVTYEWELQARL